MKLVARALPVTFLAVVILAISESSCAGNTEGIESHSTPKFRFSVQKGRELPLCVSYTANLNRVDWHTEPFCERPIAPSSKEFGRFRLLPLSADEREALEPQVAGLMEYGDANVYFSKHVSRLPGLKRDARKHAKQDAEAALSDAISRSSSAWPTAYRYSPAVDVDNNGIADDVTFWRETGFQCGSYLPADSPVPTRAPRDAFVLSSDGSIDVRRSHAWFYPTAPLLPEVLAAEGSPIVSFGWRSSPRSIGVLSFRGRTYIDNTRSARTLEPRSGVVEVHEIKDERVMLRCEIAWRVEDAGEAKSVGATK